MKIKETKNKIQDYKTGKYIDNDSKKIKGVLK